jgi:hypothetical protein
MVWVKYGASIQQKFPSDMAGLCSLLSGGIYGSRTAVS